MKMRPPIDREIASDMPRVVLTSDSDLVPTVLDHSIEDLDQWAQNRPIDGPTESERPFDNLDILKATKTITNSNNDNSDTFETIFDYFENFDQYLPTYGLYEAEPDDLL